ncbi:MAG: twin-arginine translocase TatA/TatE family subunit [Solirubrobacteraceae bacterium]
MLGLDNPIHLVFLLVLLLLVFGAKRLPEMGRSLGSGMRGFKDAITGEEGLVTHETRTMALERSVDAMPESTPSRTAEHSA